jgi:hypothetical protein
MWMPFFRIQKAISWHSSSRFSLLRDELHLLDVTCNEYESVIIDLNLSAGNDMSRDSAWKKKIYEWLKEKMVSGAFDRSQVWLTWFAAAIVLCKRFEAAQCPNGIRCLEWLSLTAFCSPSPSNYVSIMMSIIDLPNKHVRSNANHISRFACPQFMPEEHLQLSALFLSSQNRRFCFYSHNSSWVVCGCTSFGSRRSSEMQGTSSTLTSISVKVIRL